MLLHMLLAAAPELLPVLLCLTSHQVNDTGSPSSCHTPEGSEQPAQRQQQQGWDPKQGAVQVAQGR